MIKWISKTFWGLKQKNHSEFITFLEQHLSLRNFVFGYSLSAIDVLVISFVRSTEAAFGDRVKGLISFAYEIVPYMYSQSGTKWFAEN